MPIYPNPLGRLRGSLREVLGSVAPPSSALPKLTAAVARVKAGTGRGVLMQVGDSTTRGSGSKVAVGTGSGTNPSSDNGSFAYSTPHLLAQRFAAAGVPSRSDALFGNGNMAGGGITAYATYHPAVSFGSGWGLTTSNTLTGFAFTSASGAGPLTFTPKFAANTFMIGYNRGSGFGSFTVSDASGVLATINGSGASAYILQTVTRAANDTSPITIQHNGTGGTGAIGSVIPYSTINPMLEIWNLGWSGARASSFLSNSPAHEPFSAFAAFSSIVDAATIRLGFNEANDAVTTAAYQTNLTSLATRLRDLGYDTQLLVPYPTSTTGSGYYMAADRRAVPPTVATNLGLSSAIDMAVGLTLGSGDYFDTCHLAQQGSAKVAVYEFNRLNEKAVLGLAAQ